MMPQTMVTGFGTLLGGLMGGVGIGQQSYGLGGQTMAGYSPANLATGNTTVWEQWNTQYFTVNATATNTVVWASWNEGYQAIYQQQFFNPQVAAADNLKKVEAARTRAKEFLIEHLSPAQKESYEKHGMFIVEGSQGNRYRLAHSNAPRKVRDDKDVTSYCIHTYGVPREDELLGFKLLLEADEDEFLKTANATALAA